MKLTIISHSEHYTQNDGTITGFGPLVIEINNLIEIFEEITHIAMLYPGPAPLNSMVYTSTKIKFVPMPPLGGTTFFSKVKILISAPKVIAIVRHELKKSDFFQLRTPTGIGVFLIPYLTFFVKMNGWFKYAGNWNQENPPLGYAIQRKMLKLQKRKVTINGHWPSQPKHCISFENPCLTLNDLESGRQHIVKKNLEERLSFCFVGRLESEKGVERIIKAFTQLSNSNKTKVKVVHMVGEGKQINFFRDMSASSDVRFIFHGAISRDAVIDIYKQSDVLLLPTTASEGFPKVIAEAMCFGCIPIVSSISSIPHYIKHGENGFLLDPISVSNLVKQIEALFHLNTFEYKAILKEQDKLLQLFTFSHYNSRIISELLNPSPL